MKGLCALTVIGKALESYNDEPSKEGLVRMLVMIS